ncbi:MAG: hypothetical protein R2771_16040 [Saprospiraceae bacterium]
MKILFNDIFLNHDTGNHPENKDRFNEFPSLKSTKIMNGQQYIGLVHNGQYINDVEEKCRFTNTYQL